MKRHWEFFAFGPLFHALNLFFGSATVEAAPSAQKVVIAFAAFSERTVVPFIANDQRFFEEQGLNAQVVRVSSAPVAMSALAAGDAHFYTAGASG